MTSGFDIKFGFASVFAFVSSFKKMKKIPIVCFEVYVKYMYVNEFCK